MQFSRNFHWTPAIMEIDGQVHPWYCFVIMFPLN
jgi:hypothetical protein